MLIFLQGFTKFYEFSSADMRAGADIINRLFMKSGKLNLFLHFTKASEYLLTNLFQKVSKYPFMLVCLCVCALCVSFPSFIVLEIYISFSFKNFR